MSAQIIPFAPRGLDPDLADKSSAARGCFGWTIIMLQFYAALAAGFYLVKLAGA